MKTIRQNLLIAFGVLMGIVLVIYGFDFLFVRGRFVSQNPIVIYTMLGIYSFTTILSFIIFAAFIFISINIFKADLFARRVIGAVALLIIFALLTAGYLFPRAIGQNMATQHGYVLCLKSYSGIKSYRRDSGDRYYAVDEQACESFKAYYADQIKEVRRRPGTFRISINSSEIRFFNRNYPHNIRIPNTSSCALVTFRHRQQSPSDPEASNPFVKITKGKKSCASRAYESPRQRR